MFLQSKNIEKGNCVKILRGDYENKIGIVEEVVWGNYKLVRILIENTCIHDTIEINMDDLEVVNC